MTIPLQLLVLLDSRSPAGAHSHSGGMEAAVTAGYINTVEDVQDFCHGRLYTAGRVAAGFAVAAFRAWRAGWTAGEWAMLDAELTARIPSAATRAASRSLGSGLQRLLRATVSSQPTELEQITQRFRQCPAPSPHQPLVLGAAAAMTGGTSQLAARAAALAICTSPASAAVRILGLDPFAVHRVTAGLAAEIEVVADAVATEFDQIGVADLAWLPSDSSPALDLLADVHSTQEVRLFAS
ncbi:urease accessory protein UreF [Jatrophihabitans sp. DSM 45814]